MIVTNRKKISILKRTRQDEYRIVNIYTDENGEVFVDYEFYFLADMRKALDESAFNARISIRKNLAIKKVQFLSDLENKSPVGEM